MRPLQALSLIFDLATIVLTVAMFLARPRVGGAMGQGIQSLTIGFVVLGVAFVTETGLFVLSSVSFQANEVIHRVLVGIGFVLIVWGFVRMRRAFR